MIACPGGCIHSLIAVMDLVKLPQYGHFVFDPMRSVEPEVVDEEWDENHRQDLQNRPRDRETAKAVEA